MGIHPLTTTAVFLDRDGVLNRSPVGHDGVPRPPVSVEEVELLPRVAEAVSRLRRLGFALVVVTNQPDVARGTAQLHTVREINQRLSIELGISDFRVCPHDDADNCACRKPRPGLLIAAARDLGIDTASSYMVGDRWRDVEAGRRAGCKTILIDNGYSEQLLFEPDHRVKSLWEASEWIEHRAKAVGR